jgi:uncharacterized protein
MNRDELLKGLKQYKERHQEQFGIVSLGVFGSIARGEFTDASDIDIVVELQKPDLFTMGHIKLDIEEAFGRPVDIVRKRPEMNPLLADRIERDAIYV